MGVDRIKDMCVVSQLEFHGRRLCETLGLDNEDFYGYQKVPPDNMYRLIIMLGVYCLTPSWEQAIASVKGSKLLCYWVGTDLLFATQNPRNPTYVDTDHTIHLTQREANKTELATLGVEAKIMPLPIQTQRFATVPLPDDPVVGNYQPRPGVSPIDFHPELTLGVARVLPDWRFRIVSLWSEPEGPLAPNVLHVGHVDDMPLEYAKWSHVMRFTSHDGLPKTLIEAILMGRAAVANINDVLGVIPCKSLDPKDVAIAMTLARSPSHELISYWRRVCNPERWRTDVLLFAE